MHEVRNMLIEMVFAPRQVRPILIPIRTFKEHLFGLDPDEVVSRFEALCIAWVAELCYLKITTNPIKRHRKPKPPRQLVGEFSHSLPHLDRYDAISVAETQQPTFHGV
jgi:hypothetical protein